MDTGFDRRVTALVGYWADLLYFDTSPQMRRNERPGEGICRATKLLSSERG